jgi:hypothetical protein
MYRQKGADYERWIAGMRRTNAPWSDVASQAGLPCVRPWMVALVTRTNAHQSPIY